MKLDCKVYVATKMTGRDKTDMLIRALKVCDLISRHNMTPISPVLEEEIKAEEGVLEQESKERLKKFWKRDKDIIRSEAHVVLIDGAEAKSFGVEREYALNRYCLWKPTVLVMPKMGIHVGVFEDDYISDGIEGAIIFIRDNWGTRWKRCKWRVKMLSRTLPKWLYYQLLAWR